MYVPSEITTRIQKLSEQLGCELRVLRCWQSDGGRPVFYCNFRGVLHDHPSFLLECFGTLCAELTDGRDDLTDLFLFLNGQRLAVAPASADYLVSRRADGEFDWDYDDEGYDNFLELNDKTGTESIDASLSIHPPTMNKDKGG